MHSNQPSLRPMGKFFIVGKPSSRVVVDPISGHSLMPDTQPKLLLGPFDTEQDATAQLEQVATLIEEVYGGAFDKFGVMNGASADDVGILNAYLSRTGLKN